MNVLNPPFFKIYHLKLRTFEFKLDSDETFHL